MIVKIIKPYEFRPGKIWHIGARAEVLRRFGAELIAQGYGHEIIEEKRNGIEVEIEVFDNSAKVITRKKKTK